MRLNVFNNYSSETRDITELKDELNMKTNTIQLIIAEKSELQSKVSSKHKSRSCIIGYIDLYCLLFLKIFPTPGPAPYLKTILIHGYLL